MAAVVVLAATAIGLRMWNLGATFETADQATIPNLVQYEFGWRWMVGHGYGMVLPILQRCWAEFICRLGGSLSESISRLPIALVSIAQVLATAGLLRRLRLSRIEVFAGTCLCAILPALVCDAHCPWAYRTVWLLAGTLSLWGLLTFLDTGSRRYLAGAGVALVIHCLSCVASFALPVTILAACMGFARGNGDSSIPRTRRRWAAAFGFVLPCAAAMALLIAAWRLTGGGPLGHLLMKRGMGSFGVQFMQLCRLPVEWAAQFGVVFGVVAGIGLAYGVVLLVRRERVALLAVWAWAALMPTVLFTDWTTTGYGANYLLFEGVFGAGLLGAIWLYRAARRGRCYRPAMALVAIVAAAELLIGSAHAISPDSRLAGLTQVVPCWGQVHADSGAKAAGWYIRSHVPADAVVMTLHTHTGMEVPVAHYYCGRYVLADYDLPRAAVAPLVEAMHDRVDVIVVDASQDGLLRWDARFTRVATFRRSSVPVRYVYARRELSLPFVDEEVCLLNPLYDASYAARACPTVLPSNPKLDALLPEYQACVHRLKAAVATGDR